MSGVRAAGAVYAESQLHQDRDPARVAKVQRHRINAHRLEPRGKRLYKRRKETVQRSFADAKQLHSHRYARMRGRAGVQELSWLAAAAPNLKKMALLLSVAGPQLPTITRCSLLSSLLRLLQLATMLLTAA